MFVFTERILCDKRQTVDYSIMIRTEMGRVDCSVWVTLGCEWLSTSEGQTTTSADSPLTSVQNFHDSIDYVLFIQW